MLPGGRGIILFTTALIRRARGPVRITAALFRATVHGGRVRLGGIRTRGRGLLGDTGVVTCSNCFGSGRGPRHVISKSISAG